MVLDGPVASSLPLWADHHRAQLRIDFRGVALQHGQRTSNQLPSFPSPYRQIFSALVLALRVSMLKEVQDLHHARQTCWIWRWAIVIGAAFPARVVHLICERRG